MVGYGIFFGCVVLLGIIYLSSRKKINPHGISCMVFGNGTAGNPTMTFSIFAAWMWTTSIFGSAETYALYGIWGPISYVVGACIAFAGLIAFLAILRKRYPLIITWLGFVQARYGRRAKLFYYFFALIVPAYVLIEQGVGIAYLLETFYGSSFKIISFFSVLVAMAFVFFGGMKAVLSEEKITSIIILIGFAGGVVWVMLHGDMPPEMITPVAARATGLTGSIGISVLRYFVMAIVIAFSQIVFDSAYYIKAQLVDNIRRMAGVYTVGGIVLWGGITLAASLYMGSAATVTGTEITELFHGPAKAVFSVLIILIGISTIAHFMTGWMGIFSLDLYDTVIHSEASERRKITFARIMLVAVGLFCASMTIALENISLLTLDIFCAIFFAAPCVPLIIGCTSQRNFGKLPVLATVLGIFGGLIVWILVYGDVMQTQLLGIVASIMISLLVMLFGYAKRQPLNP